MNSMSKLSNMNIKINNSTLNKTAQSYIKTKKSFQSSLIENDLRSIFPDLKINYASIPSGFNETNMRQSGFGFGKEYGSLYNVTIDPKIAEKMESDSEYRTNIVNEVTKQLSTPIPQLPGVKVASAGAIVHSDGSVTGYIIGEPDKDAVKEEAEFHKRRIKEHQEEAEKKRIEAKEYQNILAERAMLLNIGLNIK